MDRLKSVVKKYNVNDQRIIAAIDGGYVVASALYLADFFDGKASEAYAHRVCRPWHTDHPSKTIEENYHKLACEMRLIARGE